METDGLCGQHPPYDYRDICTLDMGHSGECKWRTRRFALFGGITYEEVVARASKGSVSAQAVLRSIEEK